MKTLKELAEVTGGNLIGEPSKKISGVCSVGDCQENEITFAIHDKFVQIAKERNIGALFISEEIENFPHPQIIVPDPKMAAFQAAFCFAETTKQEAGISPFAFVDSLAKVDPTATVMPFAYIGPMATVGQNSILYPGSYIGENASIGNDCTLFPNSVVGARCLIGNRVILHDSVSIGTDGFGYYPDENGVHQKIPQLGIVQIEDDVEVGACSCIDRATFGRTKICKGTKIDNQVQIAHNCVIGENGMIVSQTGLAGSTEVEQGVTFAARSATAGHVKIGEGAIIGAQAAAISDVAPGAMVGGIPARNHIDWKRSLIATEQLPKALIKLRRLEKKVAKLQEKLATEDEESKS